MADTDIAIVGMSGRFPGADDVDRLWERVVAGDDCLVDLDPAALVDAGIPADVVDDPAYVRRAGVMNDVAGFDHEFFGIGARDAALMDPQHRHFLECAWEALETSAHVPERFDGAIGVFAGCGMDTYLLNNLVANQDLVDDVGWFLLRHTGNDKDFLPTFTSYKLDLRGPSISVQTACSTSLVAIHLAVQSLLSFECDIALAGGSTIEVPHGVGYHYRQGEILSPEGRCRAFDAESDGTVLASGVGVVALRRLDDAIADGDPVLAVIKGTAVNNDGSRKVGFLAPSVDGHADVVKEALAVAGVGARDIQLLEAHGTGTAVGDPIEVAALTEAFRASTSDRGFCRLVSTKPNIGHLDTAAGVASVIKVVQALRHRTLPPLANHTGPNSLLDLDSTPFTLSGSAAPWDAPVRRAGVSSLGVGGTNAHIVLEEAPRAAPAAPAPDGPHVLVLSARSTAALDAAATRLADALDAQPELELADVAATLLEGRRAMEHRRIVVTPDAAAASATLRERNHRHAATVRASDEVGTVFLFPGGGAQYVGMGSGLTGERFATYHEVLRDGIAAVRAAGGPDLDALLAPDADEELLRVAETSLPAVFVVSVAMARQWLAWGARPDALVGHSLGEYVAAHLAGVLSFEDAVGLVVTRSRLMSKVAGNGSMLVVELAEAELAALLPADLSIATINATDECVVAGPSAAIDELAATLGGRDIATRLIPLNAAAHSALLDPVLDEFREAVRAVALRAPQLRYTSNLTGTWILPEQATDPDYWVAHLRGTVRFADCLATALAGRSAVTVEVGPGHTLSSYARRQPAPPVAAVATMRHPNDVSDDAVSSLLAFARTWGLGAVRDLTPVVPPDRPRVRLPAYPFQHTEHWIDPPAEQGGRAPRVRSVRTRADGLPALQRLDLDRWFWQQRWVPRPAAVAAGGAPTPLTWSVVADPGDPLADRLTDALRERGCDVHRVAVDAADGAAVLADTAGVVLLGRTADGLDLAAARARWLDAGIGVVRALGHRSGSRFVAITAGAVSTDATPAVRPADALALGPVLVAPHEYPSLRATLIDLDDTAATAEAFDDVVSDVLTATDSLVAYRDGVRLGTELQPLDLTAPATPVAGFSPVEGATFLVTGGLGEIGSTIAGHLAASARANLVLLASRALPERHAWERWLATHGIDDPTSRRIRRVIALEAVGTKVEVVVGDAADPTSLGAALAEAERLLGPVDGIVHAAGALNDKLLDLSTPDDVSVVLGAKAFGAATLLDALTQRGGGLLLLVGSTSTLIGAAGQTAYVAANGFLDALAGRRGVVRVVTLDFGVWAGTGMAASAARAHQLGLVNGELVEHPVFTSVQRRPNGTIDVIGKLSTEAHWVVDEHRTADGQAVLPGTGHIDLMLAAARHAGLPTVLEHVTLVEALTVPDGVEVSIRVSIGRADDTGAHELTLESDRGAGREWQPHSEARVAAAAAPPAARLDEDLLGVPDALADPLAAQRRHLVLGGRWLGLADARRFGDRVIADVQVPSSDPTGDVGWLAHPAALDLATCLALDHGDATGLAVPVQYEYVASHRPVPTHVLAVARHLPPAATGYTSADLQLIDPVDGAVVLEVNGLHLRTVDPSSFGDAPRRPTTAAGRTGSAATPFIALAEGLGIRADEAGAVVGRALAADEPRVIVSSVDVRALVAATRAAEHVEEPGTTSDAGGITGIEGAIAAIWRDLLGVADVTPDADFFDLGGHSLIAIRMMARIEREMKVMLPLASLFEASTLAAFSDLVVAAGGIDPNPEADPATSAAPVARAAHRSLVPFRATGDETPFVITHGAGGNVLFLAGLVRAMSPRRPVYGLQALGISSNDLPDTSIESMAERYVGELRAARPGPYLLGGYSGGGLVALEMSRQLQALGEEVRGAILFDSVPPGRAQPTAREQWTNVIRHVARRDDVTPYLRYRAARIKRALPPWRGQNLPEHEDQDLGFRRVEEQGFVNLYYYFTAVAERYELASYDVDTVVIKADHVWPTQPPDYFWSPYITGELTTVTSPGDHHTMFMPINAPQLADRVERELDRLDHPRRRDADERASS